MSVNTLKHDRQPWGPAGAEPMPEAVPLSGGQRGRRSGERELCGRSPSKASDLLETPCGPPAKNAQRKLPKAAVI